MKKTLLVATILLITGGLKAQEDSSAKKIISIESDTIKVGSISIIKGQGSKDLRILIKSNQDTTVMYNSDTLQLGRYKIVKSENSTTHFNNGWIKGEFGGVKIYKTPRKLKEVTTNWFVFDLGFANYRDESPSLVYIMQLYPGNMPSNTVTPNNLKLNNSKSSNFNLWIVQQKVNLYQHKLNLKYGIGLEMFNFRFDQPVSFRNDLPSKMIMDNISFSKNKLFAEYLTMPIQLNYQPNPQNKRNFYVSAGLSAGYLISARNKQISAERGKQKYNGNFNLNNWRVATIGELGIGGIRLFGSYGLTNLFDKQATYFEMYPFAFGLRFSIF
ncbi:MAG: outer membrane beta-barrel protein [Bacteroidetes bacterium]|nr:outer membrane beta-barrel protein [Bacteroidota bacterium]